MNDVLGDNVVEWKLSSKEKQFNKETVELSEINSKNAHNNIFTGNQCLFTASC